MVEAACFVLALASLFTNAGGSPSGSTKEDGSAWIAKAEQQLYRWPAPGALVRFDVKTNVLAAPIAALEREVAAHPNAEQGRLVAALKRTVVHGTVDTVSGTVRTVVSIPCETSDPEARDLLSKMKGTLTDLVRGAFDGLPVRNPALVAKGSSVAAAEAHGDAILVRLAGARAEDQTLLTLDRKSALPRAMQTSLGKLAYAFTEVAPGSFAPAALDVFSKSGAQSRAQYTWQQVGGYFVPANIQLTQGAQSITIVFESVRVEPHTR